MSVPSGSQGTGASQGWGKGRGVGIRPLEPGEVLQGRYEVLKVLGLGGMSTVYLARDRRFAGTVKLCAVKEMAELSADPEARQESLTLFEREANMLAGLSHPAIPGVYDYFSEGNKPFLVLEFIDGKDLEAVLESTPGFLAEEDVVSWAVQICEVLTYLHNLQPDPIIFRDIKPSNIMLGVDGRVHLIDFGIAKVFQTEAKGTIVGTEGYAPPEQYKGIADPRTDVYALGATMHHLLTKSDPRFEIPFTFHERPPRKLNPGLSEALDAVISRALQYDMEKRFTSIGEMKQALLEGKSPGRTVAVMPAAPAAPKMAAPASGGEPHLLWEFACGDEVRSTPLVLGDTVCVGSYDKAFYALDSMSGAVKWKLLTQAGICSSACQWRETVVFGSEDRSVYAAHLLTGRLLWDFRTAGPVRSSPRADGDRVFFGSDDQYLYAVDGKSGRLIWRSATWKPIRSSPVAGNGLVYVGSDDENVYGIDIGNGVARWKFHTMGPVMSSPVVAEGLVIFGSVDGHVYAVDAATGFPVWRMATEGKVTSSPVVVERFLLIGSVDKVLYCLDPKTGRRIWDFATEGPITSSPRIYGDAAYLGSVDGNLYCVDLATGRQRWKFKTQRPIPGSAAFGNGMVYFGSLDGKIYALSV